MSKRSEMTKDENILHELYRKSYAASNPKGDWEEILKKAKIVDGKKEIPYRKYKIDQDKLDHIFDSVMKKHKVPSYKVKAFRFEFYLGCSPCSK